MTEPIAVGLARSGVSVPPDHRLVSLAEDPALAGAMSEHNGSVWPEFALASVSPADHLWERLEDSFADFQVMLIDPHGRIAAALNSAPFTWDGTIEGLPDGWDEQFERSVDDHDRGRVPTTLGALQIVVAADRQGERLSGLMVETMKALARARGFRTLVACVRPTLKELYPLVPIERYARWTREDGLPFDPWVRLHVRLGGRIVRPSPASMTMRGSVSDWERWTGMAFPESGSYVVGRAAALVEIDRERDEGVYLDPNVWVVHEV